MDFLVDVKFVQLANGLCYAVRIRFSRFERLHAELLRELPGVPLPPLPQKRGPLLHVRGNEVARRVGSVTARHPVASWGWVQALGGRGGHAAHCPMGCLGTAARLGHCCESPRPAITRPGQAELTLNLTLTPPGRLTWASGRPSWATRRATRAPSSGAPPRSTATCAR